MITVLALAADLGLDADVITALAWDIACQDQDLVADYDRFSERPKYELATLEISDALAARIKDSLDTVSDEIETSRLFLLDTGRDGPLETAEGWADARTCCCPDCDAHAVRCPDCGWWGDGRNACDICAEDE